MAKIKQGDIVRIKNSEEPESYYYVYSGHENNAYIVYIINCVDACTFVRKEGNEHGATLAGQWIDVSLLVKVSK